MGFIITHTEMDPLTSVCHFLVERQKRGGGGLAAVCHSFLRLLLFQVSPPPTPLPRQAAWIYIYTPTGRPTDSALFKKKGKRNAGQNRIDSLMDCKFLFHPGIPRKRRWLAFVRSRFGCGQPIFGGRFFENCVVYIGLDSFFFFFNFISPLAPRWSCLLFCV